MIPELLANPSAYDLIKKILSEKIIKPTILNSNFLCSNPNSQVIKLLGKYPEFLSSNLSSNSSDAAIDIILENPNLQNVAGLVVNTNPRIIPLLKKLHKQLPYDKLSANPIIFYHQKFTGKFINKIISHIIKMYIQYHTNLVANSYDTLIRLGGQL